MTAVGADGSTGAYVLRLLVRALSTTDRGTMKTITAHTTIGIAVDPRRLIRSSPCQEKLKRESHVAFSRDD